MQKIFYFEPGSYETVIKPALLGLGGEIVTNPDVRSDNKAEFYHFPKSKLAVLYGGRNSLTINGLNEPPIKGLVSKLLQQHGIKLAEPGKGIRTEIKF